MKISYDLIKKCGHCGGCTIYPNTTGIKNNCLPHKNCPLPGAKVIERKKYPDINDFTTETEHIIYSVREKIDKIIIVYKQEDKQ